MPTSSELIEKIHSKNKNVFNVPCNGCHQLFPVLKPELIDLTIKMNRRFPDMKLHEIIAFWRCENCRVATKTKETKPVTLTFMMDKLMGYPQVIKTYRGTIIRTSESFIEKYGAWVNGFVTHDPYMIVSPLDSIRWGSKKFKREHLYVPSSR